MKTLKLADNLTLPVDVVTQTMAILAKRRVGKSYTMRRIAEQLLQAVALTDAGRGIAVAENVPTTTDELHDVLRAKLPPAKWKILEQVIRAYPHTVTKDTLAMLVDVPATSGGYKNNLGSLRTLGLIDYPSPGQVKAQPVLFLEGR